MVVWLDGTRTRCSMTLWRARSPMKPIARSGPRAFRRPWTQSPPSVLQWRPMPPLGNTKWRESPIDVADVRCTRLPWWHHAIRPTSKAAGELLTDLARAGLPPGELHTTRRSRGQRRVARSRGWAKEAPDTFRAKGVWAFMAPIASPAGPQVPPCAVHLGHKQHTKPQTALLLCGL